jgi:hypothetical protein
MSEYEQDYEAPQVVDVEDGQPSSVVAIQQVTPTN